jgi:hypothetical protein
MLNLIQYVKSPSISYATLHNPIIVFFTTERLQMTIKPDIYSTSEFSFNKVLFSHLPNFLKCRYPSFVQCISVPSRTSDFYFKMDNEQVITLVTFNTIHIQMLYMLKVTTCLPFRCTEQCLHMGLFCIVTIYLIYTFLQCLCINLNYNIKTLKCQICGYNVSY